MRSENWQGLITNASPYALPPGAAVEQVNFHNSVPGQLTSRGGMRAVNHLGDRRGIADCCAIQANGTTFLLAVTEDGLHALESPAYGEARVGRLVPAPDSTGGVVETTYLWHYEGYGQTIVSPDPGPGPDPDVPGDEVLLSVIDGGTSGSVGYIYYIDANQGCGVEGEETIFDGGRSSTPEFHPALLESSLCEIQ